MKSGIKAAVSLLVAILIFGGIAVASSLGLFSSVEQQFYEPARLKIINEKLDSIANCGNEYIQNLLVLFGAEKDGFLSHESVFSLAGQNPSAEALHLFESLKENCAGLEGFRIVDSAGKRVFYSSFRGDYVIQTEKGVQRRIYSNYGNLYAPNGKNELEYPVVSAYEDDKNPAAENSEFLPRIIFDGGGQRLIFSYKIQTSDEKSVPCSAIFYINPADFANLLVEKHIVSVNEQFSLVSSSDGKIGGFVFGLPNVGKNIFDSEILKKWNEGVFGPDEIVSSDSGENISWSLVSSRNAKFLHIGGIFSSDMLKMPSYVRSLLLVCAFVTVCLIVVIFFSIRKDDSVVIKSKIRGIQVGLLNEYFEKDVDRKKVAAMIKAQKDELSSKIKKSLGRRGKKYGDDLDLILNKSWEDIINILSGGSASSKTDISPESMNEIRKIFEEVLAASTLKVENLKSSEEIAPLKNPAPAEEIGSVEEISDAEEIADAEPLEPLEEVPEADEVEEAEPVEELDEVESIEPLEEVSELETLDSPEMLEDAESLEEVEELEEISPAEEIEDAEIVGDAEPLEELDEVESIEPLEDAAALDEIEELEEIAPLDESLEPAESMDSSAETENSAGTPASSESEPIELQGYEQKISTKDSSVTFVPSEKCDRKKFEGSEPLEISDKTVSAQNEPSEEVEKEFIIYNPFDFAKENSGNSDFESSDSENQEENSGGQENASPLEELSFEKDGFMFTTFAENENDITELPLDAIVLGEDGVFHISSEVANVEMPIDEDFKKLVDSVIH